MTDNAPEGRFNHTAVWTGTEMIVWGGNNGYFFLNRGGKYAPSTDSWIAVSITNAPHSPRQSYGNLERQRNDHTGEDSMTLPAA